LLERINQYDEKWYSFRFDVGTTQYGRLPIVESFSLDFELISKIHHPIFLGGVSKKSRCTSFFERENANKLFVFAGVRKLFIHFEGVRKNSAYFSRGTQIFHSF
jgi:hypothetical protein